MSLPTVIERFSALPAFTQLLAAMSESRAMTHVAGLAGSADAVLVAALAERERNRLIVVVTDQLSDAERWLADLESITGRDGISLYPPREGFGEVEPHAEVAGERVETLERMIIGGFHLDPLDSISAIKRIKQVAKDNDAEIFPSHDMEPWLTWKHAPAYYGK